MTSEREAVPAATDQYVEALVACGLDRAEAEQRTEYDRAHDLCFEPPDAAKAARIREQHEARAGARTLR